MIKYTLIAAILIVSFLIIYQNNTTSALAASDCEILQGVANGPTAAPPPPCMDSFIGEKGITYPPGFNCALTGYCKMPDSTDGSYRIYAGPSERLGLKKLIGVIYTVTQRWKKMHPDGWVWVGDLNAPGHASHKTGVDVDIYASVDGKKCAANYDNSDGNGACNKANYDAKATVEFGMMFADTGAINVIFYNDPDVNSKVLEYAGKGNSPNMKMYPWPGHANHFHVRIKP